MSKKNQQNKKPLDHTKVDNKDGEVHKEEHKPEEPKKKGCTGSATGDTIGSLTAHLGLTAASIISPPGAGCATAAADTGLTIAEETGTVCGGTLQSKGAWKGVNIALSGVNTAITCVPVIGNVWAAGHAAVEGVELGFRALGGWFSGLFRPAARAITTTAKEVELTETIGKAAVSIGEKAPEIAAKTSAVKTITKTSASIAQVGSKAAEAVGETDRAVGSVEKVAAKLPQPPPKAPQAITKAATEAETQSIERAVQSVARGESVPVDGVVRGASAAERVTPVGVLTRRAQSALTVADISAAIAQTLDGDDDKDDIGDVQTVDTEAFVELTSLAVVGVLGWFLFRKNF